MEAYTQSLKSTATDRVSTARRNLYTRIPLPLSHGESSFQKTGDGTEIVHVTDPHSQAVTEALRDLARWLYRQLWREYEHQTSDAVVDETIAINQWTFTAEGRRFG